MLDGQTAYVTGVGKRIGPEIAIKLPVAGANVKLPARNEENFGGTVDLIGDRDATLVSPPDRSDEDGVESFVEATIIAFRGLDSIVNIAGIAGPTALVEEWRKTLDVNLMGTFLTVKHASPYLREGSRGSAGDISSISDKRPLPSRTP